jgi:competence protein ComEA
LIDILGRRFPARAPAEPGDGEALDINTASFEELRGLGISVTQASRVIAARESNGGYATLDELDELPGFSAEQLATLKRTVRV